MKSLLLTLLFAAGIAFVGCEDCEDCTVAEGTAQETTEEFCDDELDDAKEFWDDNNVDYSCE